MNRNRRREGRTNIVSFGWNKGRAEASVGVGSGGLGACAERGAGVWM